MSTPMNLPPLNFQSAAPPSAPTVVPRPAVAPTRAPAASSDGHSATVLSLTIKSKSALFAAFIPSLNNGGLFIPTSKRYEVGDEVLVLLSLTDFPDKFSFSGTVAWVTPSGAQNGKIQGIGVHFKDDKTGRDVKDKIESVLGSLISSNRPTHTI